MGGGILSGGFVQGDFVLAEFCPGGFCLGGFVPGDFVLELTEFNPIQARLFYRLKVQGGGL